MEIEPILYLGSSGGNGHNQIAKVLKEKSKSNLFRANIRCLDPKVDYFPFKDVLIDFLGPIVGTFCVDCWNNAQKNGNTKRQEKLFRKQALADKIFFLPIFFKTLIALISCPNYPVKIVNTQILGIKAILTATKVYNYSMQQVFKRKGFEWKNIRVEVWVTDLPETAVHFFKPIKKLSEEWKKLLTCYIPKAAGNVSLEKISGLANHQIKVLDDHDLPVMDAFYDEKLREYAPGKEVQMSFSLEADQKFQRKQLEFLNQVPNIKSSYSDGNYKIEASDKLYSIMLGSQPNHMLIKELAQEMIRAAKEFPHQKIHLILLCGKDSQSSHNLSLFRQMCQELAKQSDFPSNLVIVPLPLQEPKEIAKIEARSDIRFTRGGGSSAFEHKVLNWILGKAAGKVCILSETTESLSQLMQQASKLSISLQSLLIKKIPLWEGGNAKNLCATIGARVACKATFVDELRDNLRQSGSPSLVS